MLSLNTPVGATVRCIRECQYPPGFVLEGQVYELAHWDEHPHHTRSHFAVSCGRWTRETSLTYYYCDVVDFELVRLPEGAER